MDFNTILYGAIGGAFGGALGALLKLAINNNRDDASENTSRIVRTIPLAIMIILLPGLYKNMTLPRIIPLSLEQLSGNNPQTLEVYTTLKEREPEYYAKLVKAIDGPMRNGATYQEAYNIGSKIGSEIAAKKLPHAGANIIRYTTITSKKTFEEFKTAAPKQCVNLFYERPLDIKEDTKSKSLKDRELQVFLMLIDVSTNSDATFDEKNAITIQTALGAKLTKQLGENDNMDPSEDKSIEIHKRMCEIGAMTMGLILELNDEDITNFMRWAMTK